MDFLKDGRTRLALGGALAALLAGLAIAWALVSQHRGEKAPPPPASQAGLIIDSSGAAPARPDAAKTLRCFVGGQYVGDLALADCAKRNGVATDALDVGVDQTQPFVPRPGRVCLLNQKRRFGQRRLANCDWSATGRHRRDRGDGLYLRALSPLCRRILYGDVSSDGYGGLRHRVLVWCGSLSRQAINSCGEI